VIGIEEEFFLVDNESLFPVSFTPKLILKLIRKTGSYLLKSSMESPLSRQLFKAGFPIIEVKTSPHRDVDCLLEEVKHHRKILSDLVEEEHLLIVPSGLHPAYSPEKDSRLLCCAIHVHISEYPLEKAFFALAGHIPELLALTANSPFLNGKVCGKSMRTLYSYAIGFPSYFYKRASDVIINRKLRTVELRVCDSQIVSNDIFKLVHLVLGIIDSHCKLEKERKKLHQSLGEKRFLAAIYGKTAVINELKDLYEEVFPSLNDFGTAKIVYEYVINEPSSADFQINIAEKYGISSVVESLWTSFRDDKLKVSNTVKNVQRKCTIKFENLPYLFFYFPIHLFKLCNKFVQDDMVRSWILLRNS